MNILTKLGDIVFGRPSLRELDEDKDIRRWAMETYEETLQRLTRIHEEVEAELKWRNGT